MTPSGIEPATFPIVAQCLDQLRHGIPRNVLQIYGRFGGIQYLNLLDIIYTHDKGKIVPLHVLKTNRGRRGAAPLILYDSTGPRWEAKLNAGHFIPKENSGHTPNRRLGGPQSRSRRIIPEFGSRIVQPAAQSLHGVIAAPSTMMMDTVHHQDIRLLCDAVWKAATFQPHYTASHPGRRREKPEPS